MARRASGRCEKNEPFWSESACNACPTLNRKGGRGKSGREPLYGDGRFSFARTGNGIPTVSRRMGLGGDARFGFNALLRCRGDSRHCRFESRFCFLHRFACRVRPFFCHAPPLDARGARFHFVNCAARRELSSATSPLSVGPIARFDADCLCSVLSRLTTGAPPDRRRANRLYKTRKPSIGDLKMDGHQLGTIWQPRAASLDSKRDCFRPRQRRKTQENPFENC